MKDMHRQRSSIAYPTEYLPRVLKTMESKRHKTFRRLKSMVSVLFTEQPSHYKASFAFGELCQVIQQRSALERSIGEILLRAREARWRARSADAHDAADYHDFEMADEDIDRNHLETREEVHLATDNDTIDIFEQVAIGPATPAPNSNHRYRDIAEQYPTDAEGDDEISDIHSRPLHWTCIPLSVLEGDLSFGSHEDGLSPEHEMVAEHGHLEDLAAHFPNPQGALPQSSGWNSGEPTAGELWICSDTEWLHMSDMGLASGLDGIDSGDHVQWSVAV
ncbi:hypothetical protein WOLCODRAFT_151170 [Wolfiporia cocos MD-104 SS10]|uniref:Uncharacterized protein n=1 Tax=Wolfiporia cocos (strain MD-104) TaxID=742152 RepID=A0A2H3JG05_WOLCO|nr:hypothetical protein WOLCODRAFT_151170 [Wolfiporia cocos MD-104 SS10]